MNIATYFRAFESRNYRCYFLGQWVSVVGNWMTQTASVWMVYQLTQSAVWLGVMSFLSQLPTVLLGPVAGVWVDRLDRMKLLKATQVLAMFQSFALAAFTLSGHLHIYTLLTLAFIQGVINSFDMPTRLALTTSLAEKPEDIQAVIGMNSTLFHMGRLVGPALGGWVVAAMGAGYCFLIDGFTYLAVLIVLSMIQLKPALLKKRSDERSVLSSLREGMTYVWNFSAIRFIFGLVLLNSIFSMSFFVLVPVFAKKMFLGDAQTLGFLMSSSSVGSVSGALFLASRKSLAGYPTIMLTGAALFGCSLLSMAWSQWFPFSLVCMVGVGMGSMLFMVSCNTLVQSLLDEDKRGRVMSLYSVMFFGGMPLGGLMMGWFAERIGVSWTTTGNAIACFLMVMVLLSNRSRIFVWIQNSLMQKRNFVGD